VTDADTQNLPAEREESLAEKQRKRMDALLVAVESRHDMLVKLLADTGITFDRFMAVFRRALIKNPDLLLCDAGSVVEACINACTDGLLPDGRQGAIVIYSVNVAPRNQPKRYVKKANWQAMFQGMADVAYASGNFQSIQSRVVYDGDEWSYALGDDERIHHRPMARPAGEATPKIIAAYAIARTVNGGVFREVFEGADIEKVNAVSQAMSGPGKKWPEEMARKGPFRRMWKWLPKNEAMNRLIERENDVLDSLDLEIPDDTPAPQRKLTPGFAQPALTQSAQTPMEMVRGDDDGEFVGAGDAEDEAPSNPAAKSYEADREADEALNGPRDDTFEESLAKATSWLNVKQALKTLAKGDHPDRLMRSAKAAAWDRCVELKAADKAAVPDFLSDIALFECWLLGAEPDRDAVMGNWLVVQADPAYAKLEPQEGGRLRALVQEIAGDE
jgi:recombination protein RecT